MCVCAFVKECEFFVHVLDYITHTHTHTLSHTHTHIHTIRSLEYRDFVTIHSNFDTFGFSMFGMFRYVCMCMCMCKFLCVCVVCACSVCVYSWVVCVCFQW
jgi:hypothetical protein